MSHALHAIIGQLPSLTGLQARFEGAVLIALDQGFVLAPLSERLRAEMARAHGGPYPVPHREGFLHLSDSLGDLLSELSRSAPVAYIETDYFGGTGSQAAAAYVAGTRTITRGEIDEVAGVVATTGPINEVLRAIGVRRRGGEDERYREIEQNDDSSECPPILH